MVKLLKDLYSKKYVQTLAINIQYNYSEFNKDSFLKFVFDEMWPTLELKQRMRHITISMYEFLPKDYSTCIIILKDTFVNMKNKNDKSEALQNMIFQDFVGLYGLNHFDISMEALAHFTIDCSSEFAIREFIIANENKTMNQMLLWTKSDNLHIRRLASVGCRSRLPWAKSLTCFIKNPSKVLEILSMLQNDEVDYVKKSVANNINDISKDHPEIVLNIVKKWQHQTSHKDWILKHGSRTLLRAGDKKILELFGFKKIDSLEILDFDCNDTIYLGDNLEFSFKLSCKNIMKNLRIEYSIEFLRQNNKYNTKVFFIAQKIFNKKDINIHKKHSFKLINTRKYYAGIQRLNIIVNGQIISSKEFELKEKN